MSVGYSRYRRLLTGLRFGLLALVMIVFLFPYYWLLKTSFEPPELITGPVLLVPTSFTLEHYHEVLGVGLLDNIVNSLIAAVGTMVLTTVVALLGAYAITRYIFPGRRRAAQLVLLTYMFPNTALVVPMFKMFSDLGMLNNPATLIFLHSMIALPFSLWILQSYLESIPRELEEAALVEGATEFGAFGRITVPQAAPAIIAVAILAFIMSWGEYMFAFVLTTDTGKYTVPVKVMQLLGGYQVDWGLVAAASIVATIPVLALFWLMVKYLGRGIARGTGVI